MTNSEIAATILGRRRPGDKYGRGYQPLSKHAVGGSTSRVLVCSNAGMLGAMRTAINFAVHLDTVSDDVAIAMGALRRQCVYSAFKAVECVALAVGDDFKRFVVVVAANFTNGHGYAPEKVM
jgi:hypothetical protein